MQRAANRLSALAGVAAEHWRAQVDHYLPLIARILDQSERRVLHGQTVPASEKLVSLFEPRADIIVKSLPRQAGAAATCSMATNSTSSLVRAA